MRKQSLDRKMRLAGVGGTEHGGDAGAWCAIAREPLMWRESHIFRVFLFRPIDRHCEERLVRPSPKGEGGSDEAIHTASAEIVWIASWSLSSGRATRGPVGSQ